MTKAELFKKYSIDETHSAWCYTDTWMSIEVYRVMHNGELPNSDDKSTNWITDFLDKFHNEPKFMDEIMERKDWGSLYLTSKRMIYKFADLITGTE